MLVCAYVCRSQITIGNDFLDAAAINEDFSTSSELPSDLFQPILVLCLWRETEQA
jgi:hypothetical protein